MSLQCFLERVPLFSIELCYSLGVGEKAVVSPFFNQC